MPKKPVIELAHGSGGTMMHRLIKELFIKHFDTPHLHRYEDGAIVEISGSDTVFTTDAYVVDPLFFPGGDIGTLAVSGTVNDITVMGAQPVGMACSFIIEEGFSIHDLERIVRSMKHCADKASCPIVTGDTKVVEQGKGDGVFITTSAVGRRLEGLQLSRERIVPGDVVLVNGFIGDHGIAVLSGRKGMEFDTGVVSDVRPLNGLLGALVSDNIAIKYMRDPTRGGVASTLNEICDGQDYGIELFEESIPVREEVRGLCEILGFDPLYVANEGKLILIIEENQKEKALGVLRNHPDGCDASCMGVITGEAPARVVLRTAIGSHRIVDMLSGAQLPRIC
jgi:hydrogenase expression/formation protein HypE